ncbi:5688_t:CDS:2, partial [Dentiscutata heterogama]
PTRHTPYELVFGQHPLRYFNMIEEWKQHNVNMEENLLEAWQFTRDDSDREQINDKNTEMFSKPISQQDIQGVQGQ